MKIGNTLIQIMRPNFGRVGTNPGKFGAASAETCLTGVFSAYVFDSLSILNMRH